MRRLNTLLLSLAAVCTIVYCSSPKSNVAADFPSQSTVSSSALCNSTYAVGLGALPGRHAIGVQTQFDATPVWIGGAPNVTVAPGASFAAFYPADGGPSDAGYFNDGGADAGPWTYTLQYALTNSACYNDGGVDAGGYFGADGGYFYDAGSFFNDGGYCVITDGGVYDAGYFNDGGYAANYYDAGPVGYLNDGGQSANYTLTYNTLYDAGLQDAGPGVVGEEITGVTNAAAFFRALTVVSQAPSALYCIKASGAQDGTRDGGWTAVIEQP